MNRRAQLKRSPLPSGERPLRRKTPMPRGDAQLKQAPLNHMSKKRQRENRERKAMANKRFPDGQPPCVVPWCGQRADDLHEPLTRARRGSITDPDNTEPVCRAHNEELTREPAWGYRLHLLVHSGDKRSYAEIAADRREALALARVELGQVAS